MNYMFIHGNDTMVKVIKLKKNLFKTWQNYDNVHPSSLLNPSWVQVSQTMELFGTCGTLPAFSIKRGRGAC